MANKFYQIINQPTTEINGKNYAVETYNLNLKDFLQIYFNKDLYIYEPSILTNQIRAIVI